MLLGSCAELPPIAVEVEGARVTSESGTSVRVTVSLARRPRGVVWVEAASSDASEGRVSEPLRFVPANWATPQIITVSGVADDVEDGDQTYQVLFTARTSSADEPIEIETLSFTNRDEDAARFYGLGDLPGGAVGSYAADVSPSGEFVVGRSAGPAGDQAIRWTLAAGLQALDSRASAAVGVSADGASVAGFVAGLPQPGGIWRGSEPFVSLYYASTPPEAPIGFWMTSAVAPLADGRIFGNCAQYGTPNAGFGCVTNRPGYLDFLQITAIREVDETGNYAGVRSPDPRGSPPYGPQAIYNDMTLPFPVECFAPHDCSMEAQDFSAGGALIVGTSSLHAEGVDPIGDPGPLFRTAFTYSAAAGVVRLADLAGGEQESGAYAISDDGSVIAGFGSDAEGQHAVVWLAGAAYELRELLADALPAGWRPQEVRDLSADGRVLVGNGLNPQGAPEGFVAILPRL
jgi:hypothetical protein